MAVFMLLSLKGPAEREKRNRRKCFFHIARAATRLCGHEPRICKYLAHFSRMLCLEDMLIDKLRIEDASRYH